MLEFFKLIFSKDFITNAKDIISLLRQNKAWKKDIVKYSGVFYYADKLDSSVLVDQTIKIHKEKNWEEDELQETEFILNELLTNSFSHGLPSKENSSLKADITATSSFIKISISDHGLTFDLLQELNNQEALDPDSDKHKGLSFINHITPEIYQEKSSNSNTVIVIKRQGLKPLQVENRGDILIFTLGNSTYVNDRSIALFVERIKSLTEGHKIIIDFGSHKRLMGSRMLRDIREILSEAELEVDIKIAVCGLKNSPYTIKKYFEKKFLVFDTFEDAIDYHQQS